MSYTNKTANYELPQYTADDKPTYLGDFNSAMLKIDTDMKTIENKADSSVTTANNANSSAEEALSIAQSAESSATSASSTAGQAKTMAENAQIDASNAITTANQAKTTAESANTNANQAKTTAENANITAQSANSKVNEIPNWSPNENIAKSNIAGQSTTGSINCSYSNSLKLLSLYGQLQCHVAQGENVLATLPENIRPSEQRTIVNAVYEANNNMSFVLYIKTNGDIVWNQSGSSFNDMNFFINLLLNYSDWN